MRSNADPDPHPLAPFHPVIREWFAASFAEPTRAQTLGWEAIVRGESTLILAPTGSGKTLAAFLWAIDRIMFAPPVQGKRRCRVLYISPLKALAVDVERNLKAPIAGILDRAGRDTTTVGPSIAIRTGDTPARERSQFVRTPADILITTPESLFLLLTSRAREVLRSVETVIIDEIHSVVPTKRGAHLALSLERLEALCGRPLQRIGLSATQRPLDEVARFLGGVSFFTKDENVAPHEIGSAVYRPVTVIDTGERKRLSIEIQVPVEDMSRLDDVFAIPSAKRQASEPSAPSIWPEIHPQLVDLIRAHNSTLIFVNSRRLAERLAGSLNELAGETLALAHHGSVARDQRLIIEERLKSGDLPALVATSTLELGIDMGAIDLVIQIEAPPTVASGMQRIGRAGHQAGEVSKGIIMPKFRGDLVACAAVADAMIGGRIETIRYPRNPLDVLAQQIVAMASMDIWQQDQLFEAVCSAAPFTGLSRVLFDSVLDLLSGVYPSEEFSGLRPRITWNRNEGTIVARAGAQHVAIANAGTIPDRGLYGVFLAGAKKGGRVGELDEEMVFESAVGDTFILGATTWRIEEITHDRVVVSPASGQPGRMPFWKGDTAGRSATLGEEIGAFIRIVRSMKRDAVERFLVREKGLDQRAAQNLVSYLRDQEEATGVVPDGETMLIERSLDELGAWRVCVLTPSGGRVHAPWAMAAAAKIRRETAFAVETMWTDDGFVVRFPESDEPPDVTLLLPDPDEVEELVVSQLGSTALFAAQFRESAARALLLPRRRAGERAPLWQQRKRSSDLLQVASRFPSFPIILETYRECLADIFDLPSLVALMRRVRERAVRVETVDSESPSPFAASVLFRYVANYLYDGDAPLAERRAQALTIDPAQLRELLGEPDLRRLLDGGAIAELEMRLLRTDGEWPIRSSDDLHDLLMTLGDLSRKEIESRGPTKEVARMIGELVDAQRILEITIRGRRRFIASEDASRYRDALGVKIPDGLPDRLQQPVDDPVGDLVIRFARTHGPFTTADVVSRYGIDTARVERALEIYATRGRLIQGEFLPQGHGMEWCDTGVLRTIRRQSLAKLRHEAAPVHGGALARALTTWHGVLRARTGPAALIDAIEMLQGLALPVSVLESEVLPARVQNYLTGDLDRLVANGQVVWLGVEPLGERDGRIALFLSSQISKLAPIRPAVVPANEIEARVVTLLERRGALFYTQIQESVGGFPADVVDALWSLVWRGAVTNDTMHALRAWIRPQRKAARHRSATARGLGDYSPLRAVVGPPGSEGRWSLTEHLIGRRPPESECLVAAAEQILLRHGVVTRDTVASESPAGGATAVVDVLRGLEQRGRIRRGYFVEGIAAMQFANPSALELLRSRRAPGRDPEVVMLAATDPANPYGSVLPWPVEGSGRSPMRMAGAHVILVDGVMVCWIARGEKQLRLFAPEIEPERSRVMTSIASRLAALVADGRRRALLITEIDGIAAGDHALAPFLAQAGFSVTRTGCQIRGR